ncbi:sodium/proline symporter PutP [Maridesulfovibrio hydrothermalis]|uniref:Sodium/proline symporter n=1 Tax=Maridesulfovibrio hydrothermalis AM13 = DSM 14728 TaxID=1121451 RepID=L0RER2_9BACT|nr:sodium/proline symporter PutP [Maridesulfovibrio hydrothermalis]CCO24685.1 proline permease [Maridesulfovibrio hydrothermalis AM13 = DSM 14728]
MFYLLVQKGFNVIQTETLLTFGVYLVFLLAVGWYFYKRTSNLEGYILGGRGLGGWVTALSAQASDMSGWLLMGLPGAVYLGGMNEAWIAIGLFIGTALNWIFVSSRLRVYTELTDTLTISSFFEKRFRDPTSLLRVGSAVIILIFFTIYSSSGLVAAGKLFESMFNMDYSVAVISGTVIIVAYTFLGGFMAVCWTDFFQGALMFFAIILVPILGTIDNGGISVIESEMAARNIATSLFHDGSGKALSVMAVISTMAWGLGYFGQPHILTRFMGISSVRELPKATIVALTWVVISLTGAVIVGMVAIPMFDGLHGGDQEKVFIYMIGKLFNPWLGGVLLAAILSAIMSTIDSQLLVSSSALTEDFYKKILRREASQKELMLVGRLCVLVISIIALSMALTPGNTILGLVSYAWGGFGAAFGPVVLFALFSRKTTWVSALSGMIVGTVVLVFWKDAGFGAQLYEIVPGFAANFVTITVVNMIAPQKDEAILAAFDEMKVGLKK